MAYGTIVNSQDAKKWLQEYNKTYNNNRAWSQMYAATDLAARQAEASVKQDFAQDVADAYNAVSRQRAQVYSSNLLGSSKETALNEINDALTEAYNSYKASYQQKLSTVQEGRQSAVSQIDQLLQQQAQYYSDYTQEHFNYWTWLNEQLDYETLQNTDFADYYDYTYTVNGQTVNIDQALAILRESKPLETSNFSDTELKNALRSGETLGLSPTINALSTEQLYSKLFDESGKLTKEGTQFFDLVENYYARQGENSQYSFGSYLSTLKDSDLADWATSLNQYDYSKEQQRYLMNYESYRKFVGLDESDATYSSLDTLKYSSDEEFNNLFDDVNKAIDKSLYSTRSKFGIITKYSYKEPSTFVNNISDLASKFKVSSPSFTDFNNATNNLRTLINTYNSLYKEASKPYYRYRRKQKREIIAKYQDVKKQIKEAEQIVKSEQKSIVEELQTTLNNLRSK